MESLREKRRQAFIEDERRLREGLPVYRTNPNGTVSVLQPERRTNRPQAAPPSTSQPLSPGVQTRSMSRMQTQNQHNTRMNRHLNGPAASNSPFGKWKPDIAYGSELSVHGEDLSCIELADRRVLRARLRVEHYGTSNPIFQQQLDEEIRKRAELDENDEENTKPISTLASTHREAINKRLDLLRYALEQPGPKAQRVNIEAAIAGYESGAIPYSDSYTLIWNGRIVDTCPDYGSFTRDRESRLDTYLEKYGPGWLWHEPPLTREMTVRAKKGICLENPLKGRLGSYGQGGYHLKMYFRARKERVTREPAAKRAKTDKRKPSGSSESSTATGFPDTQPDEDAKVVELNMLVDSGATMPSLKPQDLVLLEIDPKTYAAQTVTNVALAEGEVRRSVYELDIGFRFGDDDWEFHTTPVVVLDGDSRLSGMLPFNVLYTSSAPGTYRMWVGQKRRDVLGAGRLPGRMKAGGVHDAEGRNPFYDAPGPPEERFYVTGGINLRNKDESSLLTKWHYDSEDEMLLQAPKSFRWEHDFGRGQTWVDIGSSSDEAGEVITTPTPKVTPKAATKGTPTKKRKAAAATSTKSQNAPSWPTKFEIEESIKRIQRMKRQVLGTTGQSTPATGNKRRKSSTLLSRS